MNLTIAQRLHPFSHRFGTRFMLPGTSWAVRVFPTRLECCDLEQKIEPFSIDFNFAGPLEGFTAELDLEKKYLRVFGMTQKGYMSYRVFAKPDGIWLTLDKAPEERTRCRRSFPPQDLFLSKNENMIICLPLQQVATPLAAERLSLGMHKSQDWDLMCRRLDLAEIFPHWLLLASTMPSGEKADAAVLKRCETSIEQLDKERVLKNFEALFLCAFEGVLVPRWVDTDYQGILSAEESGDAALCPLPLLTESGKLIRSLFIQEKNQEIALLPCLPPQFHCGRMTHVSTSQGVILAFEWSKKMLRRVQMVSTLGGEIVLKLPKGIRSCRCRCGKVDKHIDVDREGKAALLLEPNSTAYLDRLQS